MCRCCIRFLIWKLATCCLKRLLLMVIHIFNFQLVLCLLECVASSHGGVNFSPIFLPPSFHLKIARFSLKIEYFSYLRILDVKVLEWEATVVLPYSMPFLKPSLSFSLHYRPTLIIGWECGVTLT